MGKPAEVLPGFLAEVATSLWFLHSLQTVASHCEALRLSRAPTVGAPPADKPGQGDIVAPVTKHFSQIRPQNVIPWPQTRFVFSFSCTLLLCYCRLLALFVTSIFRS